MFVPLLAALFYGSWAAYSNYEYGIEPFLVAGLVQGSFAFAATLALALVVSWLLRWQRQTRKHPTFQRADEEIPLPTSTVYQSAQVFVIVSILLATIPATLHYAAGTPDILQAMLPGLILGNGYLIVLIRQG